MILHFHIHYKTVFGEQIGIEYFKNDGAKSTLLLQTYDGNHWTGSLELTKISAFYYNYVLVNNNQISLREWGKPRVIEDFSYAEIFAEDQWRPRDQESNAFLSTAFVESIFKRDIIGDKLPTDHTSDSDITFQLHSGTISPQLSFGICGNSTELGSWKTPILMNDADYPTWKISIPSKDLHIQLEYKYVICDTLTHQIILWEEGSNRLCHFVMPETSSRQLLITDENFRFNSIPWRGSGVAIPIFSLRSKNGFGIGEFTDIPSLVDWSKSLGMNLIQVLPINDTIANKTWQDSYPYAAISVFALHPLYINLGKMGTLQSKNDQKRLEKLTIQLNELESVDFEMVLKYKFEFFKILFHQEYESLKSDPKYLDFVSQNESWLKIYAAFCHLRDLNNTCNFNLWTKYTKFDSKVLDELCASNYENIKDVEFYYFLQYHADRQLIEAKFYARQNGIVLKGDLPIGIYRYSADAWSAPSLYNMDEQAGAPPDDYAVLGQNWGFPTYNWTAMAKDGYGWWKKRMQQLNRYFDAMRIDHILGFFRIWQIPLDHIEGTMGMFNPRLPYSRDELAAFGLNGDLSRYTMPYITMSSLQEIFGASLEEMFDLFFSKQNNGEIRFKSSFDTQKKIGTFILQNQKYKKYEKQLLQLISEVILLVEPNSNGQLFNPRITISTTQSFQDLSQHAKSSCNAMYNDYYYQRHNEYWEQQALEKLPAILDASNMLICGEDLGMIPKSVPGVMRAMNILSLEIQRMPKGNHQFGQVAYYPYFSVCSPSCHDMSTIRGWWQNDHETAKTFYYQYLHWNGLTPMECGVEIVESIINDHLASPSIFAIFPIQDLVGMDSNLRKMDANSEQINEPSNPKHYWKYRFHINIEDLLKEDNLNTKIRNMVKRNGR